MTLYSSMQYFLDDQPKSFFPMKTSSLLVRYRAKFILKHVYRKIFNEKDSQERFCVPLQCWAAKKSGRNERRTFKLDPVAELFLYNLVYQNRLFFMDKSTDRRKSFGFCFDQQGVVPEIRSYDQFKSGMKQALSQNKFYLHMDIWSYFNSIDHQDFVRWFAQERSSEDADYLNFFLSQINDGTLMGCLPMGLHPSKVLASAYLRVIDHLQPLSSQVSLRYMDDIFLADNDDEVLRQDMAIIESKLAEMGLFLNPVKTRLGRTSNIYFMDSIELREYRTLREKGEMIGVFVDTLDAQDQSSFTKLNRKNKEYLFDKLCKKDLSEAEANFVLIFLTEEAERVLDCLMIFFNKFPALTKRIHHFCRSVRDKSAVSSIIFRFLQEGKSTTEYQLFWLVKIAEDYLNETKEYEEILQKIFTHPKGTMLTQAKVLEIPVERFGLRDFRAYVLGQEKSDWLSWAAAMGCRGQRREDCKRMLSDFAYVSPVNNLIADCVLNIF